MNQITINTAASKAIYDVATAAMYEERATLAALPVLRKAFAGCQRDDVRDTIMVEYAHAIKVELKVQGTGRLVWPTGSDTAKRACNRFINRVLAEETASKREEDIVVPAEVLALAKKMAKVSGLDRKVCAKALALAFAK